MDAGELTGPLTGVPVAVKIISARKGIETTCGSKSIRRICTGLYGRSCPEASGGRDGDLRKNQYG